MSPQRMALPGPHRVDNVRKLRQILRDPVTAIDELRDKYGPICSLGFGPARLAVVGDPKLLHEMFAMPPESFRWGHKFNVLGFVVGPGSMIVSDGADHKRRRGSVQAAFTRKRLNDWIPMIVERTDTAIDSLVDSLPATGGDVDMYAVGRQLVLQVAVHAFFGERLAKRADQIGALFQRPQDYLESSAIKQLPHPFPGTARSRVRDDRRALDHIIDAEIEDRRANPSGDPLDILEALAHDASLSDSESRDQVVTLMGAGYDTTAASLAWMLWCSTLTPNVWSQLRIEANSVFGAPGQQPRRVDHTTLADLDYANRVMRETVRLHPAGVLSPRAVAVDIRLGNHQIRKGTLILWSPHLAGRDPAAWINPLQFDPDRFADLTPEQKLLSDQAWVPFGRGARNCIGFALAQMELTLMISLLAQRLDLMPTSTTLPRPVGMVVNRPAGGAKFTVSASRAAGSG